MTTSVLAGSDADRGPAAGTVPVLNRFARATVDLLKRRELLRRTDNKLLLPASGDVDGQAITREPKVVPRFRPESYFFDWRQALIAPRYREFQLWSAIRKDLDGQLSRHLVGPAVGIRKSQFISLTGQ